MSRRNDTRGTETASPVLVEGLEKRQLMAATPKIIGIKIAKAADTDGTSLNQNRITIAFDKGVRLKNTAAFSSFGYANNLLDPTGSTQVKARVGLTVSQLDSQVIQILTDRLVRKGSRLVIATGGLTDTKNNALVYDATTEANTITFVKGQNKPRYTLSNRNFRPTDLSYFEKSVFASAPTATTVGTTPAATTVRANLVTFLNSKVGARYGALTAAQVTSALATYDGAAATGIVPNANLRAALAALTGTVAEPAINSILGKSNTTGKSWTSIDFSNTISQDAPVAETKLSEGGRLSTIFRPSLAGESFITLSAQIAHEVTRQDTANTTNGNLPDSQDESIVANVIETTVYAQQLLVNPSVAANGTVLTVRSNTRLLALLNSGDTLFPYGGIFQNPALNSNGNVFVGAKTNPGNYGPSGPVVSYADWIRREYAARGFPTGATATNPTTRAILTNILGSKASASLNLTMFGETTQNALDGKNGSGNTILVDAAYIALAQTLKLNLV